MKFNTIWRKNTSLSKVYFLCQSGNLRNFFTIFIPLNDDLPEEIDVYKISEIDNAGDFVLFYEPHHCVTATLIPNKVNFTHNDLKETIQKFSEMFN